MHTATSSPHVIKSFRQLNSDLHVFFVFPVLLLSAFLRCLVHIISAGRKRSNVVMWVECHGVFERQLRFHHVSLRGVIHTYVHTRDQYQYPLNLTVAYFEPPALIAYLKLRGEESRCNLHAGAPRMLCDREMADGNKRFWRRYSDIISARNWSLQKQRVVLGYWDNRKSEASSKK